MYACYGPLFHVIVVISLSNQSWAATRSVVCANE